MIQQARYMLAVTTLTLASTTAFSNTQLLNDESTLHKMNLSDFEKPGQAWHNGSPLATNTETFALMSNRQKSQKAFVFDPRALKWHAYDHSGKLVASGRASGGQGYCRDVKRPCRTPVGVFNVHRKGNAYCKSSKYPLGRGGAPMPYCMFFHRGFAIHGSPDLPDRNASHGCIRVAPKSAQWLHRHFIDHGTKVIVKPY